MLYAPVYGDYQFFLTGDVKLAINGEAIEDNMHVLLPQGYHRVKREGSGIVRWIYPGEDIAPIPDWMMFNDPYAARGLYVEFFAHPYRGGRVDFARVDPTIQRLYAAMPWPPYMAVWSGSIEMEKSGNYALGIDCTGECWLFVDGERRLHMEYQFLAGDFPFEVGEHEIEVRFRDVRGGGRLDLLWMTPDTPRREELYRDDFTFVPQAVLRPSRYPLHFSEGQ